MIVQISTRNTLTKRSAASKSGCLVVDAAEVGQDVVGCRV